jgi:DNA-binding NarL/FixJ family response regulator
MNVIPNPPVRPPTKTTRIVLLDDNEIAREGLRSILEDRQDWEVVSEASSGRDPLELVHRLKPDLLVIDAGKDRRGIELAREIVTLAPKTDVLVLTSHASEELLRSIVEAGARGYLLKSDARRHLVSAIEAVRIGGTRYGMPHEIRFDSRTTGRKLSPREREIVQLLARGMTNKEVASTLHISVKTAETHRSNIMRKLDLHSVSALVRYALRNHIIEA